MQGQLLILTHLMIDLSPKYEPKPERPSDLDPFKPYLREGIEAAKGGASYAYGVTTCTTLFLINPYSKTENLQLVLQQSPTPFVRYCRHT